ncbi:hypothetical protein COCVIDRAFT_115533 [Bipolaris victoriae FI3]|uniref:Uncharacterized protein n=1 Tax=Bipolaris victoriae (strain FI3) TaxID=930091 RepID=W7E9S9_BIPV3|nr:hypothetical protein COCVIDRAFT_115533 [Bipolaris victoriae FI3]
MRRGRRRETSRWHGIPDPGSLSPCARPLPACTRQEPPTKEMGCPGARLSPTPPIHRQHLSSPAILAAPPEPSPPLEPIVATHSSRGDSRHLSAPFPFLVVP